MAETPPQISINIMARPRIYSHAGRSHFLHIEDALNLRDPKLRLFAVAYTKGKGMDSTAFHFLDLDDARVLFSDLAWGKSIDPPFIDYKGSPSMSAGRSLVSRVLKVNSKDDRVYFEIKNGPGAKIGEGAVKLVGEADTDVIVTFDVQEARKMAFAVLAYLQAWDVARMLRR